MMNLWMLWEAYTARNREEGQGLVEYALIIALIAIMLIAALGLLSGQIQTTFATIQAGLATSNNP